MGYDFLEIKFYVSCAEYALRSGQVLVIESMSSHSVAGHLRSLVSIFHRYFNNFVSFKHMIANNMSYPYVSG